jgi:hypothetical protein
MHAAGIRIEAREFRVPIFSKHERDIFYSYQTILPHPCGNTLRAFLIGHAVRMSSCVGPQPDPAPD